MENKFGFVGCAVVAFWLLVGCSANSGGPLQDAATDVDTGVPDCTDACFDSRLDFSDGIALDIHNDTDLSDQTDLDSGPFDVPLEETDLDSGPFDVPFDEAQTDSDIQPDETDIQPDETVDVCWEASFEEDTDLDGISDGQECLDGTDPTDPASALSWHPELTQVHPRLFFGTEAIPALLQRASSLAPEDEVLLARIRSRCDLEPPEQPTDGTFVKEVSVRRAWISLSCAFVGLLDANPSLLAKSAELMEAEFPDPSYLGLGRIVPLDEYNLLESDSLVMYCTAYDILAGSDGVAPTLLESARNRLVQRIDIFRTLMHEGAFYVLNLASQNNHPMKAFGALGLCAIAVNDRPTAAQDLSDSVAGLYYLLTSYQSVPEGGYAEGWSYLIYGSNSYLPFMVALHRIQQGEPWPYCGSGALTDGDPNKGIVVEYPDMATDPTVQAVYRLAMETAFPNGMTLNTDDADPAALHGGILAAFFDDPRFLWNWRLPAVGLYAGLLDVATFALHDPARPSQEPTWPLDSCYPEAGFVVLRSSLEADAVLLVLQGEGGVVNKHGVGHEHPDAANFLLTAFGEDLVLDPGYIDFPNHQLVMHGEDHNIVLVDGAGPETLFDSLPQSDASIDACHLEEGWSYGLVSSEYQGALHQRLLIRVEQGKYLVADRAMASEPHTYSWQLNGNGGGDSGGEFVLADSGATWERSGASLFITVAPTEGVGVFGHHLEEHSVHHGAWGTHEMLTLDAEMNAQAGFFAWVEAVPAGLDQTQASISTPLPGVVQIGLEGENGVAYAFFNRTEEAVQLSGDWPAGNSSLTISPGVTWVGPDGETRVATFLTPE